MTGIALKAPKGRVQTVYTEEKVAADVRAAYGPEKSLRAIAAEYGAPVNHADIERILQGRFPHNVAKRKALGLPPICVSCGQKVRRVRVVPEWVRRGAEILASRSRLAHASGTALTRPEAGQLEVTKEIRIYSRGGKRVLA